MDGHCCGLPFGIAAKDLRVIMTVVCHPDWPMSNLPSSCNSGLDGAKTCVIVLLLLIAFPDLLWICALNGGGEVWGENLPGTITEWAPYTAYQSNRRKNCALSI